MKRQMPNLRELAPLLRPKRPELNATRRRLDSALTIYDLRDIATRRTPKAPFDYTDGAAEAELSLARARQAFENVEFQPAVLRDVSRVDTSREVLGGALRISASICSSVGPWFERPKPNAEGTTREGCRAPHGARRPDNGRDARGADADTCTDICALTCVSA